MITITLQLTEETVAALKHCQGDKSRNAKIESILVRSGEMQRAARQLGIKLGTRRKRGRPQSQRNPK